MEKNRTFQRLQVGGWRQFQGVDIQFHDRLTILTGTNGAGKSTLLNVLTPHLGVSRPYLGVPTKRDGVVKFLSGIFDVKRVRDLFKNSLVADHDECGRLSYSTGDHARLAVPRVNDISYAINLIGQQSVLGFHMPSHRLLPNYQQVPSIPFGGIRPQDSFGRLINQTYASYYNNYGNNSVLFELKQIIAAWAAIGEGNSIIESSPDQVSAYRGFVQILRSILPKEIGFRGLKIQPPDILLETETGSFLIDSASGGLLTLIEISALIYSCTLREDIAGQRFVVTFDEPENHLHPALQRSLLPTLVDAFPQVQFIVATHSPFMVSSVRDSNVYVLRYMDVDSSASAPSSSSSDAAGRRVEAVKLDHVNKAATAGEILREVLGVPVTMPGWVEDGLTSIVERYSHQPINTEVIEKIRQDVTRAGFEDLFTEALSRIGERR